MINPPTQEQIPEIMEELRRKLNAVRDHEKWILGQIEDVQSVCTHPETVKNNPLVRWPFTRCVVCGKEW